MLGKIEIVKFLVSQGADVNALWSAGAELTPLDMANEYLSPNVVIGESQKRGVREVLEYLKSIGAQSGGGGTPSF